MDDWDMQLLTRRNQDEERRDTTPLILEELRCWFETHLTPWADRWYGKILVSADFTVTVNIWLTALGIPLDLNHTSLFLSGPRVISHRLLAGSPLRLRALPAGVFGSPLARQRRIVCALDGSDRHSSYSATMGPCPLPCRTPQTPHRTPATGSPHRSRIRAWCEHEYARDPSSAALRPSWGDPPVLYGRVLECPGFFSALGLMAVMHP